ncbi:hypothetical protein R3P38DRAFT_826164 [Favolaschia claudopus]|uniref:Uncharacterized protein n=1 Tax=Favolaschia claudopus TaxID=2862362 RepID=A0AAW0BZM6_9AGAR
MKSCLKSPSPSLPGSPDLANFCLRKCVAFGADGSEEVHFADEWDRTPTEPARNLSFQEILELEEIQQSLPHARQPAEFLRRPGKQLLSMVPIGLLPLASAETSTSPVSPPPKSPSNPTPSSTFVMPPGRARVPPPPRMASSTLTHLRPPITTPQRVKPTFAFLPLLSSSPVATPAPSSPVKPAPPSAAYNSTPSSSSTSYFPEYTPARSAADGEPDRVLPSSLSRARAIPVSGTAKQQHPVGGYSHAYGAAEAAAYSPPFGSSAYDYKRDRHDMLGERESKFASFVAGTTSTSSPSPGGVAQKPKKKKKTYMYINDEQIEIEEDDDEEEDVETGLPQLSPPSACEACFYTRNETLNTHSDTVSETLLPAVGFVDCALNIADVTAYAAISAARWRAAGVANHFFFPRVDTGLAVAQRERECECEHESHAG